MKEKNINEVVYSYSYIEEKNCTISNLFAPKLIAKLPKITMTLPKISLCENFELSFC